MTKIFNIIIFLTIVILFNSNAFGEAKLDCSQYTAKTWSGLMDKMRCKKGLPPKEKKVIKKFGDLNLFKPKSTNSEESIQKRKLECHEYSTKTLVGLLGKIRGKQN